MSNNTTTTSAPAWSPDLNVFDPVAIVPDALILSCSTKLGTVEGDAPAVRVAYVDDATAGFVSEDDEIDVDVPTLNERLIYTGKIAQLIRVSNEQMANFNTPQALSTSVARAVTTAADTAFLQQEAPEAPANTPPAGLLNISGIVDGDEVSGNLDALVDLVATVQANGAHPSHVLVAPDAWAALRKLKTASGSNATLLGAGTDDAAPRLLGIPVVVTSALPTLTGLVLDNTAVISAYGQITVQQSEHVYFNNDATGIRCTWRFGANIVRPDRLGAFTVSTDDDTDEGDNIEEPG